MIGKKSLLFDMNDQVFSIPLSKVSEVVHKFEIVKLPNPPQFLIGTINLRGQIISIYDLSLAFTGEKSEFRALSSCLLILEEAGAQFGILVDNAIEVSAFEEASEEELDANVVQKYRDLVSTVYKRDQDLIFRVNEEKLADFLGYQGAA